MDQAASMATSESDSSSIGPALPFSEADLAACVKVTECLRDHRGLFHAPWMRPLRKALAPLVNMVATAKRESICKKRERELESIRQGLQQKAQAHDRTIVNDCRLRAGRIAKLRKLMDEQELPTLLPLVPDGPVRENEQDTTPRLPPTLTNVPTDVTLPRELFYPHKCYVCQLHFTQLHDFYDRLCPSCATLNYAKRHQTADLTGKVALVTGARVKIGFFTALKLLEAGATVIATSRFPCDALERFQRESQYEQFKDRLHLFGVDLRDLVHLHSFLDFVSSTFPRLDIIIHNAAQTIRRPPQYYRHLLEKELAFDHDLQSIGQRPWPPALTHDMALQSKLSCATESQQSVVSSPSAKGATSCHDAIVHPVMSSALKSQIPLLASDVQDDHKSFPPGILDVHGRQLDVRARNSWVARLGEIETPELAEVFTINAMAPFVINNRLLPMLERAINASSPKFIVNVSAMEGKFNRAKQPTHPHTNMAKAALNMMTRTCAADLRHRKIFMNSVDTGWVNDENPLPVAFTAASATDFQTPLDEIDAAARVLDPIFTAVANPHATPEWGSFLKDYRPTEW